MTDPLKLAERCEAATGPDRELDLAIDCQARPDEWSANVRENLNTGGPLEWFSDEELPPYTASIDAAMTLVLGEANFALCREGGAISASVPIAGVRRCSVALGATPALAMCAAALRARSEAQQAKPNPNTGTTHKEQG